MQSNRENWRSINGYANYEISSFGRVRNATTDGSSKLNKDVNGYFQVCLSQQGTNKSYKVHQLVAWEFTGNPSNKPAVDHIDHDVANNHVNNCVSQAFLKMAGIETNRATQALFTQA